MGLLQGIFKLKNPEKYKGDPTNVVYRSGWELKLMMYLDSNASVIQWASEELRVPYRSPIDGKIHGYFPDFVVKKINSSGVEETVMIEVKPAKQTRPPEKRTKMSRKYLQEVKTWGVNDAKWKAARAYCADRLWKFQIITEVELGI
jgi:hypothetical protein